VRGDWYPHTRDMTTTPPLAPAATHCDDCHAEAETVPASYRLADGTLVCDTHLVIRVDEAPHPLY
jgi:hypothetical protein